MEGKTIAIFSMNPTIDTSVATSMTPGTELRRREDAERLHRKMRSKKRNQSRGEEK